jgi:tRNA U54 and U55 pseudouridine synthase Pus10
VIGGWCCRAVTLLPAVKRRRYGAVAVPGRGRLFEQKRVTQAAYSSNVQQRTTGELIQRMPSAHRISSIDDLRCDAFGTEEELWLTP